MIKFYDTCSLLNLAEKAFESFFVISDITLLELENIKTSRFKDEDVKHRARELSWLLRTYADGYDIVSWSALGMEGNFNDDEKIIQCAKFLADSQHVDEVMFITDDICAFNIASKIYDLNTVTLSDLSAEGEGYKGFHEVTLTDDELIDFCDHLNENRYNLLTNEYLIIWDTDHEKLDTLRWNGEKHVGLTKKNIKTIYFNKLETKDVYQSLVVDSILTNTITAITGKAGSGKSLLSLMVAMYLVEKGDYDRIIILYNTVKVRGAADIGFLPGSSDEKILGGALGNQLNSKFGDRYAVDMLIQQDKLRIVSMGDCRGMEIRDHEILYIPEAENTSIDLMKICLSRAGDGCKIIVEGDYKQQVDSNYYAGEQNGLKRLIDVMKGEDIFGYIELQNVWRSKIAALVEKM